MEEQNPQPAVPPRHRHYKAVKHDGSSFYGDFKYDLPKDGKPGDWTPLIEKLEQCRKGYHFTSLIGVSSFYKRDETARVFEIEYRGEVATDSPEHPDGKMCAQQIRLVREVAYNEAVLRGMMQDLGTIHQKARTLVRDQQQSEDPELQEIVSKTTALLAEKKQIDEKIDELNTAAHAINSKNYAELEKKVAEVIEELILKLEDDVQALPVIPTPIMALETFAQKYRMKLKVLTVSTDKVDYNIPGPKDGGVLASLTARIDDGRHNPRASAYGHTVDEAMFTLCMHVSNKTLKVSGVVTEHGEPFTVKAPLLLPKSKINDTEARKAAAKEAEPQKPKAKAPKKAPKKAAKKGR